VVGLTGPLFFTPAKLVQASLPAAAILAGGKMKTLRRWGARYNAEKARSVVKILSEDFAGGKGKGAERA
jgi:hypothetical protein